MSNSNRYKLWQCDDGTYDIIDTYDDCEDSVSPPTIRENVSVDDLVNAFLKYGGK